MADKSNPAMEFIVSSLRKKPKTAYADLAASAARRGMKIYPIMYGRAKALLGLVKVKPRGSGAAKKLGRPGRKPGRRGPGRPRRSLAAGSLVGLIEGVKQVERERDSLRSALDRVRALLAGV